MKLSTDFLEPIYQDFMPSTLAEIDELSKIIGMTLPASYVSFLTQYGRCGFKGEASVRTEDGSQLEVFTLFGAKDQPGGVIQDIHAHEEYLENGFIPIADNLFNDRYVLEKGSGKISFLRYSVGGVTRIPVAQSFDQFIENIQVSPDE